MTATTFETFDLLEGVGTRSSVRPSVRSDGSTGPLLVREKDERQLRVYDVQITSATREEVARLVDLWRLTAQGTLPMLWNHPDDGNVAVVFAQDTLPWRMASSASSVISITLEEFLG